MKTHGVDYDRVAAGYDRRYHEHHYPGIEANLQTRVVPGVRVLEVGFRDTLERAGFVNCKIEVAEHLRVDHPARDWLERDVLSKQSTSQLSLLTDSEYRAGIDHIWKDVHAAEARGDELHLEADLHLYATSGTVPR